MDMPDMPIVNKCTADSCAYNQEHTCHALAITVGEPTHPQCDTFTTASVRAGVASATGHVGACHMGDCQHNVDLECQAPGISVGFHENTVDCLTYQPA
ncbi:DUF1540 domain-containing protein [Saccharopolyspora erythraea]|uniref:DUF1540 domain-containing protein n=1 Tax=Saccharopolyspora erythraea TaxID=1836 RepID=UPI001BEF7DA2|nr:DUF1540 domain-containing protein [Saccharopolyspora erythraea]QUH02868.1 DUF1540 domain-containing protein [Saccharopolyspora erythraea]